MGEFNTACPYCKTELIADEEWIGMEVECPSCGKNYTMPKVRKKRLILPKVKGLYNKVFSVLNQFLKKIQTAQNVLKREDTFISICPECGTEVELTVLQKDKEYECLGCCEIFIAKEALERKCPYCEEMIKSKATVCRFCKKTISIQPQKKKFFLPAFFSKMFYGKQRNRILIVCGAIICIIFFSTVWTPSFFPFWGSSSKVTFSVTTPGFVGRLNVVVYVNNEQRATRSLSHAASYFGPPSNGMVDIKNIAVKEGDSYYVRIGLQNNSGGESEVMQSKETCVRKEQIKGAKIYVSSSDFRYNTF